MRAFTTASIATACVSAVALIPHAFTPAHSATRPTAHASAPAHPPGATHTLPLTLLSGQRSGNRPDPQGLSARAVKRFSLLGVTWDNAAAHLDGTVKVRTRSAVTHRWTPWRDIQVADDDDPDPGSPDTRTGQLRGSTAPAWVGDSDGVQVEVTPGGSGGGADDDPPWLPEGLRLDMVDPGPDPDDVDDEVTDAEDDNGDYPSADATSAPASSGHAGRDSRGESGTSASESGHGRRAARPRIISRRGWGAEERLRRGAHLYTSAVRAVFVHHTVTGNDYECSEVPAIIRSIYRYHVRSQGWRDIGYNFLIDKCGRIYEGRGGGVSRSVMGAHTLGFNKATMGVAVIGDFEDSAPSGAALRSLERLAAWKLSLSGVSPRGSTTLISGGNSRYRPGARVRFRTISGHRDGYPTRCPGEQLYERLGAVRVAAARMQGR